MSSEFDDKCSDGRWLEHRQCFHLLKRSSVRDFVRLHRIVWLHRYILYVFVCCITVHVILISYCSSGTDQALRLLLIFSVALTVEQLQDIRDVDEDLEAQVSIAPCQPCLGKSSRIRFCLDSVAALEVSVKCWRDLPILDQVEHVELETGLTLH